MKGLISLRTMSWVLFVLCLVVSPFDLYAQQERIRPEENAAVFYAEAFESLKDAEAKNLKDELVDVVRTGGKKRHAGLERLLVENKLCFHKFERGVSLKRCDFTFGKEDKYLSVRELPDLVKIRDLAYLLLLKGRYYERQNNFPAAVGVYLSVLTFAQHLAGDHTFILKTASLVIEKEAYLLLSQYLASEAVRPETCREILNFLIDYEKDHFRAEELVAGERDSFFSNLRMLIDGAKQKVRADQKFSGDKETMRRVEQVFIVQAHELADRYYGNFSQALTTNQDDDWRFAVNELEFLDSSLISDKDLNSLLYDVFSAPEQALQEEIEDIAASVLVMSTPDFKKLADRYYANLKELKTLKLAAEKGAEGKKPVPKVRKIKGAVRELIDTFFDWLGIKR